VPGLSAAGETIPVWFRLVVWDSLLGGLTPLVPLPVIDDAALLRTRRRMITRICHHAGVFPTGQQVGILARGGRRWTVGKMAAKAAFYPVKKIYRKVLYFLAVKEAVDTFSRLFHQGYLLHVAIERGALGPPGGTPTNEATLGTAYAISGTLETVDTRPVNRVVKAVLRSSGRLVMASLRFFFRLFRRATPLTRVQEKGADRERLEAASPATALLLDRLLEALWGKEHYREHLEAELVRRLWPPELL
jgi:hypothetical protein